MLQAIRSKTASIIVKAMAGLLIISFAAWGVEDFISARATDLSVASVGERDIDPMLLEQELTDEADRLNRAFGGQLTQEQLLNVGIGNAVLQRLINDTALSIKTDELGLRVSDDQVARAIHADPTFQGFDGKFSRDRFNAVMRNAGLNEPLYVERVRTDVANAQLLTSVSGVDTAPETLASLLRAYRFEKRAAETLKIAAADQPDPGTPTDEQLKAVHEAQSERFTAPEYRKFTYVHLDPAHLTEGVDVSDEELQATFEANAAQFIKPEKRTVQQMVFTDEATANEAAKQLAEGRDFLDVAKDVAEMEAAAVDLGEVTREGLLPALADAAFAVEEGDVTAPVKSPLGWHILRVTAVEAGETKTLDDVRDEVRAIVAKEKALDALYDLSVRFEDAIGGGATLEEAANAVGLTAVTVDAADRDGKAPSGADAAGLPGVASVLPVVFAAEQGIESPLTEAGDKGFFMVRVDGITAPALRPLDQVRDEVTAAWKEQERVKLAETQAKEMADLLDGGTQFTALAGTVPAEIETVGPLTRQGSAGANQTVVQRMFELEPNKAGIAKVADGYIVVRVSDVQAPVAGPETPDLTDMEKRLGGEMGRDLAAQFIEAIRQEYGVKVNNRVFEAVVKPGRFDPGQFN